MCNPTSSTDWQKCSALRQIEWYSSVLLNYSNLLLPRRCQTELSHTSGRFLHRLIVVWCFPPFLWILPGKDHVPVVWVPTLFLRSASVPWLHHSLLPTPDESPLHRGTHRDWDRPFLSLLSPAGGRGSCTVPSWSRSHCDWTVCRGGGPTRRPSGPASPGAARPRSCASAARSRRPPAPEIASAGPPGPPGTEPGWLAARTGLLSAGPSAPQCLRPSGWALIGSPSAAAWGGRSLLTSDTPKGTRGSELETERRKRWKYRTNSLAD